MDEEKKEIENEWAEDLDDLDEVDDELDEEIDDKLKDDLEGDDLDDEEDW